MFRNDEFSSFPYLLIGIGIGMVAGLLLAPRSGEEMREDIRRRTHEGMDYLNQQADKLRDGAEKVASKGKEVKNGSGNKARLSGLPRLGNHPTSKFKDADPYQAASPNEGYDLSFGMLFSAKSKGKDLKHEFLSSQKV
jgi:gas vesicle protein